MRRFNCSKYHHALTYQSRYRQLGLMLAGSLTMSFTNLISGNQRHIPVTCWVGTFGCISGPSDPFMQERERKDDTQKVASCRAQFMSKEH